MKAGITVGTVVVAAAAAAVLTAAVAGRETGTGAPAGGGNAAACAEFFQWQDSGGTALLQDARRDAADLSLRDDLGQLLGDLASGNSTTAAPGDEMAVEADCWTLGYSGG
jgi:hypothetical protein